MPDENTDKNVIARSEATKQSVQMEQEAPLTPPPPAPATAESPDASLAERIAALTAENAAAVEILSQRHADLIALQGSHDSAVTAYRTLLINSNPLFSVDLIQGASIQELDAAAQKVINLASQVRAKIEADIKSVIIPAGAPERSGPDTSGLSAREKIKFAISEKK